ncbi:MAG: hypothetical protein GY796_08750 [Chloroflexi bacterium]|nr:hypothetical protein [Chloroflexota bacterium]
MKNNRLLNIPYRGIAIRLFLTCWIIYGLHFATNIVREVYPAMSLGDHLTFDVTEYQGLHPDIFEYPGRGWYINNNLGASILGAVPYSLARPLIDTITTRVQTSRAASGAEAPEYESVYPLAREFYRRAFTKGLDIKFGMAAGVMQAGLMAPLSALSAVLMFYVLVYLKVGVRLSLALALLYAFATPIFYRTAQLNHNLLQSHFIFFAFVLLWRPWDTADNPHRPRYFLAGLLCGWTIVLDYSGMILIAAVSLYTLLRWWGMPEGKRPFSDLIWYGLGVTASVSVLLAVQWIAFGHPIYPAQQYMPDTRFSGAGYQGMSLPQLDLIFILLFGSQYGLFTSAPFLLLALYPPAWFNQQFRLIGNKETWFILFLSLSFLLFTAANQFSRMQFNTGIRHIVPVTPFLFLIAAGLFLRLPKMLAWLFAILTVYWSWALAMYRDVELGRGILEAPINITLDGPRLPWLQTLDLMGILPDFNVAIPILLLAGLGIAALWLLNIPALKVQRPSFRL